MENHNLCVTPNQHANVARLDLFNQGAVFHGYQEFFLTRHSIRAMSNDHALRKKIDILSRFFTPTYLKGRTFLDLGANAAFYCFWALQKDAEFATAVDIDDEYLKMVRKVKEHLRFETLEVEKTNIENWNNEADVVNALALIHWVYSSTALFGSLDAVVRKLSSLTKYMLIVEWISPDDPAILFFKHTEWNKDILTEEYSLENFENALSKYFVGFEVIGEVTATRKLYVAYKSENLIDLSSPLPFIKPKEYLISSRLLAQEDGIDYWSCVYEWENKIYKQASIDLAAREAFFLSQYKNDYFPKVFESSQEQFYSTTVLEKIEGDLLRNAAEEISGSKRLVYEFICDCLNILSELKEKGIIHRDIRWDNILVRNHRPVLIDFGWACFETLPYITPSGLGGVEKAPEGYCDVYSMGKILENLCQTNYPDFMKVVDLMIDPNVLTRVKDIDTLRNLFSIANGGNTNGK